MSIEAMTECDWPAIAGRDRMSDFAVAVRAVRGCVGQF